MKAVLENRPYQYNRWMIIVQQWEPVISPTFPSQIPFWINLKGIPLHFWDDKILRDIGQELGHLENYILTKTTARVRVMMDGLKPLPQDTILEFSAGKECIITLEYEKLENFCTYCLQLSHLSHDCPTKLAESAKDARKKDTSYNTVEGAPRTHLAHSQYHHKQYRDERRTNMPRLPIDEAFQQRIDRHGKPFGERAATYQSRALPLRNKITPTIYHEVQRHERSPPRRDELTTTSPPYSTRRTEPTRGHLNRNTRSPADQQWRVKAPNVVRSGSKELSADKSRPPLEINLDKEDFPQPSGDHSERTGGATSFSYCNEGNSRLGGTTEAEQSSTVPLELSQPTQHNKRRGRLPKPKQGEIRISPKVFKGSSLRKRNLIASTSLPTNQSSRVSNRPTRRVPRTGSTSGGSGYFEAVKQQMQEEKLRRINHGNQQNSLLTVKTTPKIQVFLWKIVQDALPLGMALQRRGILTHPVTCTRCGEPESADHLFLHCRFARQIWNKLPITRPLDALTTSFNQVLGSSSDMICLPPTGVSGNIFSWDAQRTTTQPRHNLGSINTHTLATHTLANTSTVASTLFTDAAWRISDKTAGCSWILHKPGERDSTSGTSTELCVASPLMAEALAVREALLHAKARHLSNICLKSDNQVLVKALNSKQHPVELYGINLDIEKLSSSFSSITFGYVPRTLNSAADALAKTALVNEELHESEIDDSMSGTTAITVLVVGDKIYVANVGESRAVLAVKDRNRVLAEDLSYDQMPFREDECERIRIYKTWANEESEGGDPPRLWVLNGMYPGTAFTRSVGDCTAEGIGVTAEPEVSMVHLSPNHLFFVVASDGIFEFLPSQAVVDMTWLRRTTTEVWRLCRLGAPPKNGVGGRLDSARLGRAARVCVLGRLGRAFPFGFGLFVVIARFVLWAFVLVRLHLGFGHGLGPFPF
ncbi:hypothetical protein Bca101_090126 [Brassica carinata]